MKQLTFSFIFMLLQYGAYAQNCDCPSAFKWLKETFEKNDAGFDYTIEKKGQQAYDFHNQNIQKKAIAVTTYTDCKNLMTEWLRFFRKFHLSVSLTDSIGIAESKRIVQEFNQYVANIPQSVLDAHEKYIISDDQWTKYLNKLGPLPTIEGAWSSPPYTIGVIKDKNEYLGFVISAPGTPFRPGDLKVKIRQTSNGYAGIAYARDFKPLNANTAYYNDYGPNTLLVGPLSFKRISPTFQESATVKAFFKSSTNRTYFEKLTSQTNYLKLSSFDISQKKKIDSIIAHNRKAISSSKNLIIDLRGNGGGSDYAYQQVLPLLYTSPIRIVGVEHKSTPLNNQALLKIVNDTLFDAQTREWAQRSFDTLQNHLGQYISLTKEYVSIYSMKEKLKTPQQIVILIDGYTGSSAEQFVLEARQSAKVKIYGRPTLGSLDISNLTSTISPDKAFNLRYGTSKSLRIPAYPVDDIGLMPDIYLDREVPFYQWVTFVQKTLED